MSPTQISPFLRAWYKWKSLRLPWRKRFLIGLDLEGNTFWEFRDVRLGISSDGEAATRWRRIVQPRTGSSRLSHMSEVRVSPAWHQWLRHVRRDPPSLEEQAADVERIRRIRELAKQADERWRLAGTTAEAVKVGEIPRHRLEAGKGIDVGKEEDESSKQEEERRQQVARTMACAGGVASGGMQEAWTRTAAREQPPRDERIDEKRKSNAAQEEDKKDPWAESERARDTTRKWQPQAWTPPRTSSR